MEISKKVLNFSIAFSIVMLSLSVFVYSLKDSKAYATPPQASADGFEAIGVTTYQYGVTAWSAVIGYNAKTKEMKSLARKSAKELNEEMK